jgi:hypothetical protein
MRPTRHDADCRALRWRWRAFEWLDMLNPRGKDVSGAAWPAHHWLLCGYFLRILTEKHGRDSKSRKARFWRLAFII